MKQQIGGYKLDLLTSDEVRGHLEWLVDREQREKYRAVSYLMFAEIGDGNTTITFNGPESGYAWAVKMIGVQLAGTGNVSVYLGSNTATAPVAVGSAVAGIGAPGEAVFRWTSNVLILTDNRVITVAGSETLLSARLHVKQVTAERVAIL